MEGNGFDEFLDSAGDVALVAPCVYTLQIWNNGIQEVDYGFVSGSILFFDGCGEGGLEACCSVIMLVRMKRLLKEDQGDSAPLKRENPSQDVSS